MYYSNQKILSYNKLFNFIVGNRGGGKSFNAKVWAIKGYLKNKAQFIYVRRYKTELEHIKNYFSDVAFMFPDVKLEVKGKMFYINDELAGWAIALSTSQKEKSTSYPNVDKIIFDEFIIDKTAYHYLKNEVMVFLDFYETVARLRDVKVEFISNAITMMNPYFIYFKIFPKKGSKFTKGNEWIIELYKNDEFVKTKKNTRFGKLIDNTQYGCYNIENEFLLDNKEFIEPMKGNTKYWCTINYMGKDYGLYFGLETGYVYVTTKVNLEYPLRFCFTTSDHTPNYIMIKSIKSTKLMQNIKTAYNLNYVRFENLQCKNSFYEYIGLI